MYLCWNIDKYLWKDFFNCYFYIVRDCLSRHVISGSRSEKIIIHLSRKFDLCVCSKAVYSENCMRRVCQFGSGTPYILQKTNQHNEWFQEEIGLYCLESGYSIYLIVKNKTIERDNCLPIVLSLAIQERWLCYYGIYFGHKELPNSFSGNNENNIQECTKRASPHPDSMLVRSIS